MKNLIKLVSLFAVVVVMTGCNRDCCNPCNPCCQPKCCNQGIWDNNNSYGDQGQGGYGY